MFEILEGDSKFDGKAENEFFSLKNDSYRCERGVHMKPQTAKIKNFQRIFNRGQLNFYLKIMLGENNLLLLKQLKVSKRFSP